MLVVYLPPALTFFEGMGDWGTIRINIIHRWELNKKEIAVWSVGGGAAAILARSMDSHARPAGLLRCNNTQSQ